MDKESVAGILVDIGTLLELKGENPFKTRAYVNAARTLESLTEPLGTIVAENRLADIKGIGDALQQKITELVTTGKLKYYDELKASVPPGLVEMLGIPGVGQVGFNQSPVQLETVATQVIEIDVAFIGLFKLDLLLKQRIRHRHKGLGMCVVVPIKDTKQDYKNAHFRESYEGRYGPRRRPLKVWLAAVSKHMVGMLFLQTLDNLGGRVSLRLF